MNTGNGASVGTAVGGTTSAFVVLMYFLRQHGITMEPEVAAAFIAIVSVPLHAIIKIIATLVERKFGVDIDGDNNITVPGGVAK